MSSKIGSSGGDAAGRTGCAASGVAVSEADDVLEALGVRVAGERVTVGGSVTVGVRVSVALGVGNACRTTSLSPGG